MCANTLLDFLWRDTTLLKYNLFILNTLHQKQDQNLAISSPIFPFLWRANGEENCYHLYLQLVNISSPRQMICVFCCSFLPFHAKDSFMNLRNVSKSSGLTSRSAAERIARRSMVRPPKALILRARIPFQVTKGYAETTLCARCSLRKTSNLSLCVRTEDEKFTIICGSFTIIYVIFLININFR